MTGVQTCALPILTLKSIFYKYFFCNDTATTEIYTGEDTLSLHDALPILMLVIAAERRIICGVHLVEVEVRSGGAGCGLRLAMGVLRDRLDHVVDVRVGHQTLERTVELVGADVDDADAVVRVEHGDRIVRANLGPVRERVHLEIGRASCRERVSSPV